MAPGNPPPARRDFATTHWSVVLAAAHGGDDASAALEQLCRIYWLPLYAYVRRHGYSHADAEDLTQEFFARLLARGYLARADPAKGRFRSFLLAGIKYLLCDERDKARRLKRGAAEVVLPLDAGAEARHRRVADDTLTPDRMFERAWLSALLTQAAERLRDEYVDAGQGALFGALVEFRLDGDSSLSYAEVAERLGQSQSAVKSAIWRLRQRHHQLVREEIARTVADPSEIDDEIRHLLSIVT